MPVRLTWKSLMGVLMTLGGSFSASINALHLPASVSTVLIAAGGVIVGLERLADSKDFATLANATDPADLRKAQADLARAKSDADNLLADANDEIARLTPLAQAWEKALAAAVPAVPADS